MDLDKLIEIAGEQARFILVVLKEQKLVPTWVLLTRTDKPVIIGTPWANDEQKEMGRHFLRTKMRKLGVTAYSFVTEAWMARTTREQWDPDKPLAEELRPRNRADREEVVIAVASNGKESRWAQWTIVRDYHEQIIELQERPFPEGAEPESWFTEMLS